MGTGPGGEEVDDVRTARWAINIPDFLFKMKAALESDLVSLTIDYWIDLVFGHANRGAEAVSALNVYSETCYPELVDFCNIRSQLKSESVRLQVVEYG